MCNEHHHIQNKFSFDFFILTYSFKSLQKWTGNKYTFTIKKLLRLQHSSVLDLFKSLWANVNNFSLLMSSESLFCQSLIRSKAWRQHNTSATTLTSMKPRHGLTKLRLVEQAQALKCLVGCVRFGWRWSDRHVSSVHGNGPAASRARGSFHRSACQSASYNDAPLCFKHSKTCVFTFS